MQILQAINTFWRPDGAARLRYPALYGLAQNVLSVPASSAPVERDFSHGGLIMRPHRAKLFPTNAGMPHVLEVQCTHF